LKIRLIFVVLFSTVFLQSVNAQTSIEKPRKRCGTAEYYTKLFKQNPSWRQKFALTKGVVSPDRQDSRMRLSWTILLPLLFIIVGDAALQQSVTDAVVQSQVDVLNEDYKGL
jgi:NADH:ubiquinone oxidoreductase subunit H